MWEWNNFWGILIETSLTSHWIVLCFRAGPGSSQDGAGCWKKWWCLPLLTVSSLLCLLPYLMLSSWPLCSSSLYPRPAAHSLAKPPSRFRRRSVCDTGEATRFCSCVVLGTVHISGIEVGKGVEATDNEVPSTCQTHTQLPAPSGLWGHHCPHHPSWGPSVHTFDHVVWIPISRFCFFSSL